MMSSMFTLDSVPVAHARSYAAAEFQGLVLRYVRQGAFAPILQPVTSTLPETSARHERRRIRALKLRRAARLRLQLDKSRRQRASSWSPRRYLVHFLPRSVTPVQPLRWLFTALTRLVCEVVTCAYTYGGTGRLLWFRRAATGGQGCRVMFRHADVHSAIGLSCHQRSVPRDEV